MAHIQRGVDISAPVERVFAFTGDWRNTPRYYDSIHDWRPVGTAQDQPGARFSYKARAFFTEYHVESEIVQVVPNSRRTFQSVSGPKIRADWLFEPLGHLTRVTYTLDYELPIPVLGPLLDALFVRPKREANTGRMLANLKALLEAA